MKYKNKKLEEAHKFTKKRRNVINPNLGFMRQLVQFERHVFGKRFFDWNEYLDNLDFMDDQKKEFRIESPRPNEYHHQF